MNTPPQPANWLKLSRVYASLPARFYSLHHPIPVKSPALAAANFSLAGDLGLDLAHLTSSEAVGIFSGNRIPHGTAPLSMAYAGHQFGNWVPRLGDGRAHLLGEIIDHCGQQHEIQLKGSGRTIFSRGGDGRAWIGPVLREFLVSEAMHALGIKTTRSLYAVFTGEDIYRETRLPGAVLTRVATSHVRVGTFEYFASQRDIEGLELLLDHVLGRLKLAVGENENPALALLRYVGTGQAKLIVDWMRVGFIHGVMNTDNMSVACETIDFGPCAFLDETKLTKVFSSIDSSGRYAFNRQPAIAEWNLVQLANSLLPLIDSDREHAIEQAKQALSRFNETLHCCWHQQFCAKIGISQPRKGDEQYYNEFLVLLDESEADFTLAFRRLADCIDDTVGYDSFLSLFARQDNVQNWLEKWKSRISQEAGAASDRVKLMRGCNPAIIPRNHQIETAIEHAVNGDLGYFNNLFAAIQRPFDDIPEYRAFQVPPTETQRVAATFCGT
ncbi:MAG: YdiU family protein [Rhodobacteraceae bacterium]|nr:YdiU family protein [Paracoccaceae bacterium]